MPSIIKRFTPYEEKIERRLNKNDTDWAGVCDTRLEMGKFAIVHCNDDDTRTQVFEYDLPTELILRAQQGKKLREAELADALNAAGDPKVTEVPWGPPHHVSMICEEGEYGLKILHAHLVGSAAANRVAAKLGMSPN